MNRGFEKISFKQFSIDIKNNEELYNEYNTPRRGTKNSAGYDFLSIEDFTIEPGAIVKIPTGIKAYMKNDEVLMIFVRSSMGFKYNVRLCNQVGIIDSDYYDNEGNEGHIWIALQNEGTKTYEVKKGEAFAQGVFNKFLVADNEDETSHTRKGGLGSTNI